MDLATARTRLAEKDAVRGRIAADLARVREQLADASQASRFAQERAREAQVAAVIEATADVNAKALAAKDALTAAFAAETTIRDRIPVLDLALGKVQDEARGLREAINQEESRRMLAGVRAMVPGSLEAAREAVARLVVIHTAGNVAETAGSIDLGLLVADKVGRVAVFERAKEIARSLRERAIGEVAP